MHKLSVCREGKEEEPRRRRCVSVYSWLADTGSVTTKMSVDFISFYVIGYSKKLISSV